MLEYGFFDSVNHDRLYNSKNFSDYFEGLIHDGVYLYVGEQFKLSPGEGMSIIVGTGRAKILNRYVKNTTPLPIDISASDSIYPRIDAIVVGVDMNERIGVIKSIQGVPGECPQNPEIPSDENVQYYVLAYIIINANATNISFENIRDMRGTSECPWVAGIIEPIDTSITDQYRTLIDRFENESKDIIDKLHDNKEIIDNLTSQIETIQELKKIVDAILTNISSGPIARSMLEVIAARTSSISGETYPSLSERLRADFGNLQKVMDALDVLSSYIVVDIEKGDDTDSEYYADDTLRITGVGSIADRAFESREDFGMLDINIGGNVGIGAFGACANLNEVKVNCQKIGDQAFWACPKLNSLTIGKSVTEIGSGIIYQSAFYIPAGVRVMYAGTVAEWNAITKADNWAGDNVVVENNVVICTDGNVEV